MDIAPKDLGVWFVCLFVVVQGLYYLKQLLKKTPEKPYKEHYVTRAELNGQLIEVKEGINKLDVKLDRVSEEVSELKGAIKSPWRKN